MCRVPCGGVGLGHLRITTRMVLLWFLATVRCVYLVTEQPRSSLMVYFPYIVYFRRLVNQFIPWKMVGLPGAQWMMDVDMHAFPFGMASTLKRSKENHSSTQLYVDICHESTSRTDWLPTPSEMGAYGAPTLKPTKLFGTWLGPETVLHRPCQTRLLAVQ